MAPSDVGIVVPADERPDIAEAILQIDVGANVHVLGSSRTRLAAIAKTLLDAGGKSHRTGIRNGKTTTILYVLPGSTLLASEAARFKLASSYPWAALSALVVLDRSRLESVGEMDSVVAVSGDYERVHAGLPPASNLVFFPYTYPSSPCELSSSEASVDCLSMHLATEIGLGAPLCSWQSHARTKAQEARRMVQWLAPMRQHVLTADNTAGSPFRSGELYSLHCVEWFDSMVELILRTNVVFGGVDFTHKLEQLSIEPNASIVAVVLAAHVLLPPGSVLDDVSGSWVYHPYEFHLADPPGAMAEAAKLFPSCLPAALHSAQPILRRVMRSVTGDEPLIVSVDDGVTRACDQN